MAITVTTAPPAYALAKTEVKIDLNTDNLFIAPAASKANFKIRWADGSFPVENQTLTITFGETILVFTFKDTPDSSGLQLISGAGAPASYGLLLLRDLKRNLTLMENFDFSYTFDGFDLIIDMLAVTAGSYGTFSLVGTVTGLTYTLQADGDAETIQPNFRTLLDIFIEETLYDDDLTLIEQLQAIPTDAGNCSFDISDALKQYLNTPFPNLSTTIDSSNYIAIVDGALRRYHLRYCEQYGTTPASKLFKGWPNDNEIDPVTYPYYSHCLNAGYSNVFRPDFNDDFVSDYLATTNRAFLTRRSYNITATQTELLIFDGLSKDNTTFKAVVVMYYTDGTNSTSTIATYTKADSRLRVMRFYVGYTELGIAALKTVGKTVQYYTVQIKDSAGTSQLFATLTITIAPAKKYNRYILFENGLGGVDTLWLYGNASQTLEFSNQLTQHYATDKANSVYNGEFGESNNRTQLTYELHSGYMSKLELDYLKDFMYSRNRYLVEDNVLKKINIPEQSIELYTDASQLFALKLTAQQSWFETAL